MIICAPGRCCSRESGAWNASADGAAIWSAERASKVCAAPEAAPGTVTSIAEPEFWIVIGPESCSISSGLVMSNTSICEFENPVNRTWAPAGADALSQFESTA